MSLKALAIPTILATSTLLVACGDDGDSNSTTTTETVTATTTESAGAAASSESAAAEEGTPTAVVPSDEERRDVVYRFADTAQYGVSFIELEVEDDNQSSLLTYPVNTYMELKWDTDDNVTCSVNITSDGDISVKYADDDRCPDDAEVTFQSAGDHVVTFEFTANDGETFTFEQPVRVQ